MLQTSAFKAEVLSRHVVFVLYGAKGELAKRAVLPTLFDLFDRDLMPGNWRLVGCDFGHMSDETFRKESHVVVEAIRGKVDESDWTRFASNLRFAGGGFSEHDPGELLDVLRDIRHDFNTRFALVHYLAVSTSSFEDVVRAVDAQGLGWWSDIVLDIANEQSSGILEQLDQLLSETFGESRVFVLDERNADRFTMLSSLIQRSFV